MLGGAQLGVAEGVAAPVSNSSAPSAEPEPATSELRALRTRERNGGAAAEARNNERRQTSARSATAPRCERHPRVTALYDEALAPSGLRSTQFAILAEIVDRDEGPPTLNQLADDLVLDRSGLGHSLRPLEREGLIRLEKSSSDRRSTLVALTDQGRERYAYAVTLWQKAQDRYASVVGEAQAGELRQRLLEIGHDDHLT